MVLLSLFDVKKDDKIDIQNKWNQDVWISYEEL
jgi:hypothetical protein